MKIEKEKIPAKRVLVIEDEQPVRTTLRDLLESSGYMVYLAEDGKEGILLANELKPDLILCDIWMPVADGYTVLESLQKEQSTKFIPFIFLTAKAGMDDLREGMNLGADDYLVKPFKAYQVLDAIKARLQKANSINDITMHGESKEEDINSKNIFNKPDRVFITVNDKPMFLPVKDIVWLEAEGEYSNVNMKDGSSFFVRKLLKQWEEVLPKNIFLRIHRSTIINLDDIDRIEKSYKSSYFVFLKSAEKPFLISKRFMRKIKSENRF